MKTKDKIIVSSIRLFNANGMVNVRLQHIADDAGISVGNLAYHYHSKEAIIIEIVDQLTELLDPIIDENKEFPGLMDFDTQLAKCKKRHHHRRLEERPLHDGSSCYLDDYHVLSYQAYRSWESRG